MSDDTVLKVGDTVSLNSGGHLMTVAFVDGDSVTCDWSVKGDVKSKSFAAAELKKVDAPLTTLEQIAVVAMKLRESRRSGNDTSTSSGLADTP